MTQEYALEQKENLPKGWSYATLEDISLEIDPGFSSGEHNKLQNGVPHLRPMNITEDGKIDLTDLKYVKVKEFDPLKKDDVLFNNTNSAKLVGKTAYIKKDTNWAYSNHMTRIRIDNSFFESKWVAICLQFLFIKGFYKMNRTQYVNQASIGKTFLKTKIKIPIPPLNEQHRMVSKIGNQFSKIESIYEYLKKTKLQLIQYQMSLLRDAFEGKLSETWRKKNPTKTVLLLKDKINENKKNQNKKLQKLPPLKTEELSKLPNGWIWARLGHVSLDIQYGTSTKASKSGYIPVLGMGNIIDGKLSFEKTKYYPENLESLEDFILKDNDVLFNRTNSRELVGKTAVYKKKFPKAVFASYLIRIKLNNNIYISDLLSNYINSIFGRQYVNSQISQQTGQANVNGTKLSMMPIPIMHPNEQKEIIKHLENCFEIEQQIKTQCEKAIEKITKLRQSILNQAFIGKLVPQDPNDEPASVLLEKIKKN